MRYLQAIQKAVFPVQAAVRIAIIQQNQFESSCEGPISVVPLFKLLRNLSGAIVGPKIPLKPSSNESLNRGRLLPGEARVLYGIGYPPER